MVKEKLKTWTKPPKILSVIKAGVVLWIATMGITFLSGLLVYQGVTTTWQSKARDLSNKLEISQLDVASVSAAFNELSNQDQRLINQELNQKIKSVESTFPKIIDVYESIVELRSKSKNMAKIDADFADSLSSLTKLNYASAGAKLKLIEEKIKVEENKLVAQVVIPDNTPVNNAPPGSGYSRQQVSTDFGNFLVSIVAGDLNSTRIVVDTASDNDCGNDCPVLALGDYVARSGAYAGINGSYFCPASYPTCAGKTNSFDTIAMNKNKHIFNESNNVYSTVPVMISGSGWIKILGRTLDWGKDKSEDAALANQPMLLSGGEVTFGGDGDPKKGSRGNRSFIAYKGNMAYIGVVHGATVAEVARVLKVMGMDGALNLDSGGSTALWSGGYKVGPGRALPNVILFVRK